MKIGFTVLFRRANLFTGRTTLALYMSPTEMASVPMKPVGM